MEITGNKETIVLWDLDENQEVFHVEKIIDFKSKPIFNAVKRMFDIIVSLAAIIVMALPMAIIAILICNETSGAPIYEQIRLGMNQEPFKIYKFRSMSVDAEKDGIQWACDDDPRVTRIGRKLRKSRMDELPQLFNILIGDMSFVGPRPERPEFYDVFDTYIDGFRQRTLVKPGLTGHAQVNGGYGLKPEEKIIYDVEYIKNRSIGMDLQCIFKTVQVVFTHEGAK